MSSSQFSAVRSQSGASGGRTAAGQPGGATYLGMAASYATVEHVFDAWVQYGAAMPSTPRHVLAGRLGVPVARLTGLRGCADADLTALADLVEQAMLAEDEAVDAGLQKTLAAVPLPLRGRARTLLLGDPA